MADNSKQMTKVAQVEQPVMEEILGSDLAHGYLSSAYNLGTVNLNALNPTEVWLQIQWDPWLAMVVYQDLEEKDDAVASALETRKDGVLSKARRVLPATDKRQDKKVAEFIEETLNDFFNPSAPALHNDQSTYQGFDSFLFELLDAMGKGVSVGEILWDAASDRIFAENVKFHPQHLFSFNEEAVATYSTPTYFGRQTGPLRLRHPYLAAKIEANGLLPANKFMVGTYRPRYSNRWGSPQLRKVYWMSWFKRMGLKQMLRYVEKGSGSVIARYNDGAPAAEQNQALAAARAVNEDSSVALPKKFIVEVMEHVRQSLGSVHKELVDELCNNAIMRVILGQTLTSRGSEGGGSRALGDVHQQVRAEKIEADAKFLMNVVNRQLLRPLALFNFGPNVKLPSWVIDYDPKRDLSADSVWHARVTKEIGLPVPKKFFYEHYQLPEPVDGEDVIGPSEQGDNPDLPGTGVDPAADFAEKKTPKSSATSKRPLTSKTARFNKLRPSTKTY